MVNKRAVLLKQVHTNLHFPDTCTGGSQCPANVNADLTVSREKVFLFSEKKRGKLSTHDMTIWQGNQSMYYMLKLDVKIGKIVEEDGFGHLRGYVKAQ
jgi:hypothetical protein